MDTWDQWYEKQVAIGREIAVASPCVGCLYGAKGSCPVHGDGVPHCQCLGGIPPEIGCPVHGLGKQKPINGRNL